MAFGDADLDTYLSDFGVPVVYGAAQLRGISSIYDEGNPGPEADNSTLGRWWKVLVKTGAMPGLQQDTPVIVDGTLCYIKSFDRTHDGAFTYLYCQAIGGTVVTGSVQQALGGVAQLLAGFMGSQGVAAQTLGGIAQAASLVQGFHNILFVGDSVTVGYQAIVSGLPGYVEMVRSSGQVARGPTRGEGLVPTHPLYAARYAFTGTWSMFNYGPFGGSNSFGGPGGARGSNVSGSTASILMVGDTFDIFYVTDSTTAAFTVQVDSDTPISVGGSSGSPVFAKRTVSPLNGLAGAHTITITAPASGYVIFWGVSARAFGTSGLMVHKSAILGTVAGDYTGGQLSSWLASLAPELVVYAFEINDYQTQVGIATYTANVTALANAAKAAGCSFILMATNAIQTTTFSPAQSAYVAALSSLVTSLGGGALIDIFTRWGPYTSSGPNGLVGGDGIHPTAAGHLDMATLVLQTLGAPALPPRSLYGITTPPTSEYDMSVLPDLGYGEGGVVDSAPDANTNLPTVRNAFGQVTLSKLQFPTGATHHVAGPLSANVWNYLQNKTKYTAFAVFKNAGVLASGGVCGEYANQSYGIVLDPDGVKVVVSGVVNNGKASVPADTASHVVTVQYDGTQSTQAARLRVWIDGALQTLTFAGTIPASLPNSAGGFIVGQFGAPLFVGDFKHSLVYADTAALNDTDAATVTSSLKTLWGAPNYVDYQVYDSATRANSSTSAGTPTEKGSAYTAQLGTWGVSSNAIYTVTGTNGARLTTAIASPAALVSGLMVTDAINTHVHGLLPRFVDNNNYCTVSFFGGTWAIATIVAGVANTRASGSMSSAGVTASGAQSFHAIVTVVSNVVTVTVNTVVLGSYTLVAGEISAFGAALNAGASFAWTGGTATAATLKHFRVK